MVILQSRKSWLRPQRENKNDSSKLLSKTQQSFPAYRTGVEVGRNETHHESIMVFNQGNQGNQANQENHG
ncbi:hypothetical protein GW781_08535 [bacterium]|nr:hypothetical protein [bacterium]NCT21186.1 hypothetical protein [bacterium]